MRVLITGGYGCIGSWVARELLERGHQVWMYDLRQDLRRIQMILEPEQLQQVNFVEGDVTDLERLRQTFRELQISHLVHLAGLQVPVCRADPLLGARVNVLGTENLLAAADGRRVLVASSAEVYGLVPEDEQPIGEDRQVDPRTPYALTKAAAERLALGRGAVVVRSFNLVGPGQSPNFALPAFAGQLAKIAGHARGEGDAAGGSGERSEPEAVLGGGAVVATGAVMASR